MATLSDSARRDLWAAYMQEVSTDREPLALTKADLRAAVDALDTFLSDNAAAINTAIPQPARGALTTAQKARLLVFVIRARYLGGV